MVQACALPEQETGTVTNALVKDLVRVWCFTFRVLGFSIRKTRITALYQQSDGLVERFMHTLRAQLVLTTSQEKKDWDFQLQFVLMACSGVVQESMGCTPSLLMLGRELKTPPQRAY